MVKEGGGGNPNKRTMKKNSVDYYLSVIKRL